MKTVFEPTLAVRDVRNTFCPGCGHGILLELIGECIEELGIRDRTLCVYGVGCSTPGLQFTDYDRISVQHGRAAAAATGAKRVRPDKIVYTYQGDGDAAAIGLAETVHAAIRGENITVIEVNNTVFGMTGGQMAPTTLEGQITSTSPYGRNAEKTGYPLHLPEMLAEIPGAKLAARVSLYDPKHIRQAKRVLKQAFENQVTGKGYSFVEVMSDCPTSWHMSPAKCMDHIKNVMEKEFPIGVFKE